METKALKRCLDSIDPLCDRLPDADQACILAAHAELAALCKEIERLQGGREILSIQIDEYIKELAALKAGGTGSRLSKEDFEALVTQAGISFVCIHRNHTREVIDKLWPLLIAERLAVPSVGAPNVDKVAKQIINVLNNAMNDSDGVEVRDIVPILTDFARSVKEQEAIRVMKVADAYLAEMRQDWVISLTRTVAVNAMETMREQLKKLARDVYEDKVTCTLEEAIDNAQLPTELTDHIAARGAKAAAEAYERCAQNLQDSCNKNEPRFFDHYVNRYRQWAAESRKALGGGEKNG